MKSVPPVCSVFKTGLVHLVLSYFAFVPGMVWAGSSERTPGYDVACLLTNFTFNSPGLVLGVSNGDCTTNYTFTQTLPNVNAQIISGATVTINLITGTNATYMTGITFNGTAVNMGLVSNPANEIVKFPAPVGVAGSGTAFTIVLQGVTNAPSGSTGTASVDVPNVTGGSDSYGSYSYKLSALTAPFFDYTGGNLNYTTANSHGWCINNLVAGSTYCFDYIFPASGTMEVDFAMNSSDCGSSSSWSTATYGLCSSMSISGISTYNAECTLINAGSFVYGSGAGCNQTAGTVYTACYTAPSGCSNMSFCPMIKCAAGTCGSAALPVELLFFAAAPKDKSVVLNWACASETNNAYFTVERSQDGRFYQTVASVKGAGNTSTMHAYEAIDESPFMGVSYYRLKQSDFDGSYKYAVPVSVSFDLIDYLHVFYNLTDGSVGISLYNTNNNSILSLEVYDMQGKRVISHTGNYGFGYNSVSADASNLNSGLYLIALNDGTKTICRKILISKG